MMTQRANWRSRLGSSSCVVGAGSVIRGVRHMRLLLFSLLFVACGCRTVVNEAYRPSHGESVSIHIDLASERSDELVVEVFYWGRDRQRFNLLPEQASLTDRKGRRYRLEFGPRAYPKGAYSVHAFGPLPASSPHRFRGGPYTLSVAYTADGGEKVAERTFTLKHEMNLPLPGWMIGSAFHDL